MNFYVMTLFPDMVEQGLNTSIIGRATEKGLLSIKAVDIRAFSEDKHKRVDDYPYGGGHGAVMQADPLYRCWEAVCDMAGGYGIQTEFGKFISSMYSIISFFWEIRMSICWMLLWKRISWLWTY